MLDVPLVTLGGVTPARRPAGYEPACRLPCQTVVMRAALYEGPHRDLMVVDDVEIEEPHAGEVRVRVSYCGVCHSDLHFVEGQLPSPAPAILGHEAAGVVEKVGVGVDQLAEGDKVILTLSPPCGRCYFCARGEVHLC